MQNLIIDNILLVMLIPLWIFLIVMGGRFFSVYVNKIIIYLLTLSTSLYGVAVSFAGLKYLHNAYEWTIPFLQINNFSLSFGLHADRLSLIFALLLFTVSFCVQLFAISYMKEEKKNYRFFAYLNLFNFAMASLLFSSNLYQLYVFWEIIGVVSYLLIGFEYFKEQKSDAAKRVFLVNRIGDTALISAIILTTYIMLNYSGNHSFASLPLSDFNAISTMLAAYTSTPVFLGICALFIFGAIVKSAQYPFHIWLQDAMEAKLPVSALLHSATMVAAGVYLVIRLMPFFTLNPLLLKMILMIGLVTSIICPIQASIETEPKKILAYSTSANLGLVFIAIGLGNIRVAIIFLIIHAFTKSMLFLALPKENKKDNLLTLGIFIAGALSLSGLFFAGFLIKEFLYDIIQNTTIKGVFLVTSFITAFYITRLCFLIHKNYERTFIKNVSFLEITSMLMLLTFNIVLAFYIKNWIHNISYPFAVAAVAICIIAIFYKLNLLEKFKFIPKISESILYKLFPYLYNKFALLMFFIEKNLFLNYKPILCISKLCVNTAGFIEKNIMNQSVKNISFIFSSISALYSKMQSKNVQTYNAYAFIIVTMMVVLVSAGYIILIKLGGS